MAVIKCAEKDVCFKIFITKKLNFGLIKISFFRIHITLVSWMTKPSLLLRANSGHQTIIQKPSFPNNFC